MSWNVNEVDPAQLRKVLTIFDAGTLALKDVFVPAGGELLTGKNAGGLGAAAGTLVRIGNGGFYYAGAVGDANTEGVFFIVVNSPANIMTAIAYVPVVGLSGKIWIPIELWNNGDRKIGFVPGAHGVQVSLDGVAWVDATGTFQEIGYGAYLYTHDIANLPGFVGLRVTGAGVEDAIAWGSVAQGTIPNPPTPAGIGSRPTGVLAGVGYWSV